ncbi:hypothetical protein D3C79_837170 [compost metagenome]
MPSELSIMNSPALWSLSAVDTSRLSISRPSQPDSTSRSSSRMKMYRYERCSVWSVSHSSALGDGLLSLSACNCSSMRGENPGTPGAELYKRLTCAFGPVSTYSRLTCLSFM